MQNKTRPLFHKSDGFFNGVNHNLMLTSRQPGGVQVALNFKMLSEPGNDNFQIRPFRLDQAGEDLGRP